MCVYIHTCACVYKGHQGNVKYMFQNSCYVWWGNKNVIKDRHKDIGLQIHWSALFLLLTTLLRSNLHTIKFIYSKKCIQFQSIYQVIFSIFTELSNYHNLTLEHFHHPRKIVGPICSFSSLPLPGPESE